MECGRVEIPAIGLAGRLVEFHFVIRTNTGHKVGTIVADIRQGIILPCGYIERGSAGNMHERREFPVIDQQPAHAVHAVKVTLGDDYKILYMPIVESTRTIIESRVIGVLNVRSGKISLPVCDVQAL